MDADTPVSAAVPPAKTIDVPWELNVPVADLYIVGYGMRLPNDLTLETLAILKQCKRVFGGPPISAPAFGIPQMENVMELYAPDKPRLETYREMVALVLEAAADGPVAFATYGSAMVGTLPAHRLLEEAPRRGLAVHVANAVSSFDGIWADFNIEPFYGFQIWEASVLVTHEVIPDTKATLLLPQAPVYGVKTGMDPSTLRIEPSREVSQLQAYLRRFYPADHVVHVATTSTGLGSPLRSIVKSVPLSELDSVEGHESSTLVVPRLEHGLEHFDFDGPATNAAGRSREANGKRDVALG
jgi:uncharacterized protein YabN with tetrapyrrole methylase and pyrophosphatase domain